MFEGCERKDVGYNKFFNGHGSLNIHYYNQIGVEQIQSFKFETLRCFLFSFSCVLIRSSFFPFHVSKIHHASSCDFEKLQVQTHFPSCYKC
jgi:hypothetical protein